MKRRSRSSRGSGNQVGTLTLVSFVLLLPATCVHAVPTYEFPMPRVSGPPKHYVCLKASAPPVVDGHLDDRAWQFAPWTDEFIDIEGELKPAPRFSTRVKMLWDDDFFYVAAEMEEPHIWAKLNKRDSVIFYDNDFEVFIDPDGDTHDYYELEVNAFGTEWDLLLTKPYRDGGTAIDSWDIQGLRTGVDVRGTLNDPSDTDEGWSVELAIPWSVLEECAHRPAPPEDGDQWYVNFSRVEWQTEVVDGDYVKVTDQETGRPLPEDNWVWSPQGLINMHYPEMWGYVQFSTVATGTGEAAYVRNSLYPARYHLMDLYYRERTFYGNEGVYTDDLQRLRMFSTRELFVEGWPPVMHVWPGGFEATLTAFDGTVLRVNHEGRLW